MEKDEIKMSNLPVEPLTKVTWDRYMEQRRTRAMTLQQVLIHCEKTGFDPATAPLGWEEAQ